MPTNRREKNFNMRISEDELASWQARAKEAGIPTSEWVRAMCSPFAPNLQMPPGLAVKLSEMASTRLPTGQKGGGADDSEDLQRESGVSVDQRSARRNGGIVGAIKNVAHEAARRHGVESVGSKRGSRVGKSAKPEKSKSVECPHGIKKGWRCTLCRGIVK